MVRHICLVVLYPFGSDQAAPPTCGDSSSDGTTQPPTVGSFSTWRYFTSLFRWYLPSDPTIVMTAPAITASAWTLSQRFFLVYAITGPGHGRHATGDRELLGVVHDFLFPWSAFGFWHARRTYEDESLTAHSDELVVRSDHGWPRQDPGAGWRLIQNPQEANLTRSPF